MVSAQPAPTGPGAARDAEPEAARPRRLLRGDGELLLARPYESDRGAGLAEVAFSAQLERLLRLGEPVGTAGAVSAAGGTGDPLGVPSRVNRWLDEPDAVIPHVRICGSPGWATAQGDPARSGERGAAHGTPDVAQTPGIGGFTARRRGSFSLPRRCGLQRVVGRRQ